MEAHVSVEREDHLIRRICVQTPKFSMVWQDGRWREAYPTIEDLSDNFVLVRDERQIAEFVREATEALLKEGGES